MELKKQLNRVLMILVVMVAFPAMLSAQSILKGVVTDDSGEPIIGATISEVGTKNAAVSDFNGNFELRNTTSDAITVSYIG